MKQNKKESYKKKLLEERNRLKVELKKLADEERVSLKKSTGELSSYDNHPADQGSDTFEREKDLGLWDSTFNLLKQVDNALKRIDTGKYGICQRCGREIAEERLKIVPYSNLCKRCKKEEEDLEAPHTRPLAEEILSPPFGRGFNNGTDKLGYDAEDAWQDVAQYGNSDTFQDLPELSTNPKTETYLDIDEIVGSVGIEDSIYNYEIDELKKAEKVKKSFTDRKGYDEK